MKKINSFIDNIPKMALMLTLNLIYAGCGLNVFTQKPSDLQYQSGRPNNNSGNGSNGGDTEEINFTKVKNEVFAARCFRCHNSGTLNFSLDDSIFNNLETIKNEIESGSMPDDGPLTARQKFVFTSWIQLGSPR